MALPLLGILAAELGVLGGVQFLRNKADDKSADAAAQQFQGFMGPGGAGESIANNNPLAAAGLIDRMLKIRESDDGFLNTGKTQGINSLFAEAQAMLENQQAAEQMAYQRGEAAMDRTMTAEGNVRKVRQGEAQRFAGIQSAYRNIAGLASDPNASFLELQAQVMTLLEILDPGAIKTEGDVRTVQSANPLVNQLWDSVSKASGGQPTQDSVRNILRTASTLTREAQQRWKEADKGATRMADSYRQEGINIARDRVKGLWGVRPGFEVQNPEQFDLRHLPQTPSLLGDQPVNQDAALAAENEILRQQLQSYQGTNPNIDPEVVRRLQPYGG